MIEASNGDRSSSADSCPAPPPDHNGRGAPSPCLRRMPDSVLRHAAQRRDLAPYSASRSSAIRNRGSETSAKTRLLSLLTLTIFRIEASFRLVDDARDRTI